MTRKPHMRFSNALSPGGGAARWVPTWVLLFVQVLAFLHLGLSHHRIDTATGNVLHVEPGPSDDGPTSPPTGDFQHECVIFSALTQVAGLPAAWMGVGELPPLLGSHASFPSDFPPQNRRDLHRLSPSNSPPAVA